MFNEQLEQTTILLEDTGKAPKRVIVDLGYRGVDQDNPTVEIIHRGKYKSLTNPQRRWLKLTPPRGKSLPASHTKNLTIPLKFPHG